MSDVDRTPADDSKGDDKSDFKPPKDGSWIPRDRFNEAVMSERAKREVLEAQLANERQEKAKLEEAAKAKAEPQYSRAELKSLVDEGKLSEDQAETLWERQVESRLQKKLEKSMIERSTTEKLNGTVSHLLTQYKTEIPDLENRESEAWKSVEKEYRFLVETLGEPPTVATEVKACRAIFGPVDTIKNRTKGSRETHKDTGSDGDDSVQVGANKISNRLREHYSKMIERGQYKSWDDPDLQAELKIATAKGR